MVGRDSTSTCAIQRVIEPDPGLRVQALTCSDNIIFLVYCVPSLRSFTPVMVSRSVSQFVGRTKKTNPQRDHVETLTPNSHPPISNPEAHKLEGFGFKVDLLVFGTSP